MKEQIRVLRFGQPLPLLPFVFHGSAHSQPAVEKLPLATITATPGYTLLFFTSAVHLAIVPTGGDAVFYIDETAYEDK